MQSYYADGVRFKFKRDERKVILSIRLTEETLLIRSISVEEFKVMMDQLRVEIDEYLG